MMALEAGLGGEKKLFFAQSGDLKAWIVIFMADRFHILLIMYVLIDEATSPLCFNRIKPTPRLYFVIQTHLFNISELRLCGCVPPVTLQAALYQYDK